MYDVIIIGGGPAGMTAGIYLARSGAKTLILEKETIGGQIASAPLVENYPGFISIAGADLATNMYEQVINAGAEYEFEEVLNIKLESLKKVVTETNEYSAKAVIIASGSKYRQLGLSSESKYIGNGISFCTSCDGAFYKDKIVAVIGGGNTAAGNALYLADIAKKVYLIYRGETLKCEKDWEEKLNRNSKIEMIFNATLENFYGESSLESIDINVKGDVQNIKLDGLFEAIGMDAQTELVTDILDKTPENYIISKDGSTNAPGIFVAGDCREKEVRQLTTAVNDGSIAAILAIKYLKTLK